jgi:hypothetical protein
MIVLSSIARRRVAGVVGACALALGGFATAAVAGAGSADAAACTTTTPCAITGTAGLTAGVLTMTAPDALTWAGTLAGVAQDLVDANGPGSPAGGANGDEGYAVDDATGSGAGWNVTVSATTFTNTVAGTTLPDTGTFSTNGSTTAASTVGSLTTGPTATTRPDATCTVAAGDCTLPNDTAVTYPVAITTAATAPTAVTIYNAGITPPSGLGSVTIGTFGAVVATNPVGWWVHVPGNAAAGSYTSTITISIVTGPSATP